MLFQISNFGKIIDASIKLDGITVICGDNNTGKSTVGKALFCFFNSLNNYRDKIDAQKNSKLIMAIRNYVAHNMDYPVKALFSENTMEFISNHNDRFTMEEVKDYLEQSYRVKISKERLISLVEYLNAPESEILNEYVYRFITNVMNGQIKNNHSANNSKCFIAGEISYALMHRRILNQRIVMYGGGCVNRTNLTLNFATPLA